MREIKFRAWDKKSNCWIANGDPMDLYYSARTNCFMFDNDNYDLDGNVEFVQYTGLKDKNGKEIYEGDILGPDLFIGGEVHYFSNGFYVENSHCGSCPFDTRLGELEVIGNIYENPELLKTEEDK